MYLHDALRHHDLPIDTRLLDGPALPPDELTAVTERFAADRTTWDPIVRHDPEQRWYTQLLLTDVVEVWLIGWAPGQRTRPTTTAVPPAPSPWPTAAAGLPTTGGRASARLPA